MSKSRILVSLVVCLIAVVASRPVADADPPPEPELGSAERFTLFAVNGPSADGNFPILATHCDLVDKVQQPRGTDDVFGVATGPEPQQPGDPEPPGIITLVAKIEGGTIVGEGLFGSGGEPFTLAVVGGTGRYRRVRGQMQVVPKQEGRARVVFQLLP